MPAIARRLTFPTLWVGWVCSLIFVLWFFVGWAHAQTADTTVSALPWYKTLEPFLQAITNAILAIGIPIAAALLYRFTGIKLQDSDRIAVQTAAANGAGRILAGIEGPVGNIKFNVGNPVIAAEAVRVHSIVEDEAKRMNITPDAVAAMIAGKLGQIQQGVAPATPVAN